jgi:hypothetical protein
VAEYRVEQAQGFHQPAILGGVGRFHDPSSAARMNETNRGN